MMPTPRRPGPCRHGNLRRQIYNGTIHEEQYILKSLGKLPACLLALQGLFVCCVLRQMSGSRLVEEAGNLLVLSGEHAAEG